MVDKILIIDDHPLYAQALYEILKIQLSHYEFIFANSLEKAHHDIQQANLKLVFLDQNLSDGKGSHFIKTIKSLAPTCSVVLMSGEKSLTLISEVLNAGAAGFIAKDATKTDIEACIDTITDGEIYLSRSLRFALKNFKNHPRQKLSDKQSNVLLFISEGYTNPEIAEALGLPLNTVKNVVAQLMALFEVDNRTQLASEAYKQQQPLQ